MTYLVHHGILGQKWGVRRYQNPDGSLTPAGEKRYGKQVRKAEKEYRKNGYGENYKRVNDSFTKTVLSDKKYLALSKKATELEAKRLLLEKEARYDKNGRFIDEDDSRYEKLLSTDKYIDLDEASRKAYEAKTEYANKLSDKWVDQFKDAVLDDLNITENRELAKKYLRERGSDIYDDNLDWNPDSFYEPDVFDFNWSARNIK